MTNDIVYPMTDLRVFAGYVWLAYPVKRDGEGLQALLDGLNVPDPAAKLPLCYFGEDAKLFGNYHDQSIIIVTAAPTKPTVPAGWEIVPLSVPEGFGGVIDGWKVRHVHTLSADEEKVYAVFVALAVQQ